MSADRRDGRVERGRTTRERLLAAAQEQFGRHGYDGTSIAAVLDDAGVAKGALYHHFPSKEALFDAVLDRVVAAIATAAAEAGRGTTDPLARLRAGCFAWLELALDPAVQRISLLDAPAVVGWSRWREIDEQHVLRGLRLSIDRLAAAGRVPKGDTALLAHMVLAAVNEAALLIANAADPGAALDAGRRTVDTLLTRLASGR